MRYRQRPRRLAPFQSLVDWLNTEPTRAERYMFHRNGGAPFEGVLQPQPTRRPGLLRLRRIFSAVRRGGPVKTIHFQTRALLDSNLAIWNLDRPASTCADANPF